MSIKYARIVTTVSGDNTLIPAVAGKKYRILHFTIGAITTQLIKFKSGSTDLTGTINISTFITNAGGGFVSSMVNYGLMETNPGEAFIINSPAGTGGNGASGFLVYQEINV